MVQLDADDLQDQECFCFRVSDIGTKGSLLRGYGFTSHHPDFYVDGYPMSASKFRKEYNHLYWDKETTYDRRIHNHITGGWARTHLYYIRECTPWISTTESFDWAIWEIARRLTITNEDAFHLSVIRNEMDYTPNYRGARMIGVDALDALVDIGYDNRDEAVRYARSSSEVLWYGRIFDKDIIETTTWTHYVGFTL